MSYNWFPGEHAFLNTLAPTGRYAPTGVIYRRSKTRIGQVMGKGLSKTYLIGEKFLPPNAYSPGPGSPADDGDNECMFTGYNNDVGRTTYFAPRRDVASTAIPRVTEAAKRFGSAHPTGIGMTCCDGSVQFIGYDVDLLVFKTGGRRADEAVSAALP